MNLSRLEKQLVDWTYESKRLDVLAQTTLAFIDTLFAQKRLALAEESLALAEKVFDTVAARVKAGRVAPLAQTKAGVALATSRVSMRHSLRLLDTARAKLAASWGEVKPEFEKVAVKFDTELRLPALNDLMGGISKNPDVARWATEIETRRASFDLADARSLPAPTVSLGIRRFEETDDGALVAGVSIPLPIFGINPGNRREAQIRITQGFAEQRSTEARLRAQIAETYQDLVAAHVEIRAYETNILPGAQLAYESARQGYLEGRYPFLDLLDSQRTLFEAQGRHIDARHAYHRARVTIERLIGAIGEEQTQ